MRPAAIVAGECRAVRRRAPAPPVFLRGVSPCWPPAAAQLAASSPLPPPLPASRAMSTVPLAAPGASTADGGGKRPPPKVTLRALQKKAAAGVPISVLTAYDFTMAAAADAAGVDVVLVGDSVGMVVHGDDSTARVSLDDMARHCEWVARGAPRPFLVGDLPFGTYAGPGAERAVASAVQLVQRGRVGAVKLEGGVSQAAKIAAIVAEGIPVMGHVGLLPQTAPAVSGYALTARTADAAVALLLDAAAVEAAGAFAVVLEKVPSEVAAAASALLRIPTIGIGAGPACGGQVLVAHDLLGLYPRATPKFVRGYEALGERMRVAFAGYCADVASRSFPDALPGWTPPPQPEAAVAASRYHHQHHQHVHQHTAPPTQPPPAAGSPAHQQAPRYHFRMPPRELGALLAALTARPAGSPADELFRAVGPQRYTAAVAVLERLSEAAAAVAPASSAHADATHHHHSAAATAPPAKVPLLGAAPAAAAVTVASPPPPAPRRAALPPPTALLQQLGRPLNVAVVGTGAVASLAAALLTHAPAAAGTCSVTLFTSSEDRAAALQGNASEGGGGLSVRLHDELGGATVALTGGGAGHSHHPPVSVVPLMRLPSYNAAYAALTTGASGGGGGSPEADAAHAGAYDLVLLATKAYQVRAGAAAAVALARRAPSAPAAGGLFDRGYVLPLLNGGYTLEYLAWALGRQQLAQQLLYGTTAHGAMAAPLHSGGGTLVTHTGMGTTLVAPAAEAGAPHAQQAAAFIADLLAARGLAATALPPAAVPAMRWAKVAVNSVLNPVAALTGLRNGEVEGWHAATADAAGGNLLQRLAAEAYDVMTADLTAGGGGGGAVAHLASLPGWADFSPTLVPHGAGPSSGGAYIASKALSVARATAPNVCSFLADLRAGRPTEVQFVNGWVAERGAAQADRAGPPPTVHADVQDALLAKEGLLVPARGWFADRSDARAAAVADELAAAVDDIRNAERADV